jgi:hypothetical protein
MARESWERSWGQDCPNPQLNFSGADIETVIAEAAPARAYIQKMHDAKVAKGDLPAGSKPNFALDQQEALSMMPRKFADVGALSSSQGLDPHTKYSHPLTDTQNYGWKKPIPHERMVQWESKHGKMGSLHTFETPKYPRLDMSDPDVVRELRDINAGHVIYSRRLH